MSVKAAIVGPGNIGTDLMYKVLKRSDRVDLSTMVGILPVEESDGLQRAEEEGIDVATEGIESVKERSDEIDLVFEATSAKIHADHAPVYDDHDIFAIDLTPAGVGPFAVPVVNVEEVADASNNVNMITCGGQGTIPIVHAIDTVTNVEYAEIISTIASKSAGPGTRKNIDEFTQTTAAGLQEVGGADDGKAIIVLNPAEPPIMNRNTIYTEVSEDADLDEIRDSVARVESEVQSYVPGFEVTLEPLVKDDVGYTLEGTKIVTTMVNIQGVGDYLPEYAGNLDIMTSAALGCAENLIEYWERTSEVRR